MSTPSRPIVAVHAPTQPPLRYEPPTCTRCGDDLDPAMPGVVGDDGVWNYLQPADAILLHVSGGYGMGIDPLGVSAAELTAVVCGPCLRGFVADNPWLRPLLAVAGADVS